MSKRYSVVCLRHGESEWNKENLFCGWHDVNLSPAGVRDASEVSAAALKQVGHTGFDVCFTSCLTRARQTLDIILRDLEIDAADIFMNWRLNERHYGALTGFNKRQMANMYGEQQVQIWRRSYNTFPPPITEENPYYEPIRTNPKFKNIPLDEFPDAETLETTMQRVVPFWTEAVVPQLKQNKRVLIVAHGTSLRGLVKHVKGSYFTLLKLFLYSRYSLFSNRNV